jgi:preprotein translocase subunit SecG
MLTILINVLLAVLIVVCLLIIVAVLMQRPKNEGLGAAFGGGMTDSLFGAQTTNVLASVTRWLGVAFFGLTLLLSVLYARQGRTASGIQQRLKALQEAQSVAPVAPLGVESGSAAAKPAEVKPADSTAVPPPSSQPPAVPAPSASPAPTPTPAPAPAPAPTKETQPAKEAPAPKDDSAPKPPAEAPKEPAKEPAKEPVKEPGKAPESKDSPAKDEVPKLKASEPSLNPAPAPKPPAPGQ